MTAGPVFYFSVVGRETEAEGKTITREHCEASTGRPVPAAATERLSERSEFGADSSESARGRGRKRSVLRGTSSFWFCQIPQNVSMCAAGHAGGEDVLLFREASALRCRSPRLLTGLQPTPLRVGQAAVPKPLSPPPRAASHPANAEICHTPVRPSARLSPFRDSCTKTLDKIPSLL